MLLQSSLPMRRQPSLLPCCPSQRAAFALTYKARKLSMSVFSATYGLSVPPSKFGLRAYANFLLPSWMRKLVDYRRSAALLSGLPGGETPVMTVVDFSAIDSGLAG